jgi:hypothetical protein
VEGQCDSCEGRVTEQNCMRSDRAIAHAVSTSVIAETWGQTLAKHVGLVMR